MKFCFFLLGIVIVYILIHCLFAYIMKDWAYPFDCVCIKVILIPFVTISFSDPLMDKEWLIVVYL